MKYNFVRMTYHNIPAQILSNIEILSMAAFFRNVIQIYDESIFGVMYECELLELGTGGLNIYRNNYCHLIVDPPCVLMLV